MKRRPFCPAVEPLERRESATAYAPWLAPNHVVIRWRAPGVTEADRAVIGAVLADVTRGSAFRVREVAGPGPVDATFSLVDPRSGTFSTTGSVRRFLGRGSGFVTLPAGLGSDPLRWIRTIGHEVLHLFGIQHPTTAGEGPPIGPEEWAKLDALAASIGRDHAWAAAQWGRQPGVVTLPGTTYDPFTLSESNPFRGQVPDDGLISRGDRLAVAILGRLAIRR